MLRAKMSNSFTSLSLSFQVSSDFMNNLDYLTTCLPTRILSHTTEYLFGDYNVSTVKDFL